MLPDIRLDELYFEAPLLSKEKLTIQSSTNLINRMIELLKSVKRES